MRKTLAEIYADAFDKKCNKNKSGTYCAYVATQAVASAVRKRVKRKLAADARRNDMAKSEWVLR